MDRNQIIKKVEDYAEASGLAESTICQYAIKNRLFVSRLRAGDDYRVKTAERLSTWINQDAEQRGLLAFRSAS